MGYLDKCSKFVQGNKNPENHEVENRFWNWKMYYPNLRTQRIYLRADYTQLKIHSELEDILEGNILNKA